jgi:putative transposase
MCERFIPTKQQDQIKPELRALFYQKNRQAADQAWQPLLRNINKSVPRPLSACSASLVACLTFYFFPKEHWKTIRTNNVMERLFGEVKARSHTMTELLHRT